MDRSVCKPVGLRRALVECLVELRLLLLQQLLARFLHVAVLTDRLGLIHQDLQLLLLLLQLKCRRDESVMLHLVGRDKELVRCHHHPLLVRRRDRHRGLLRDSLVDVRL